MLAPHFQHKNARGQRRHRMRSISRRLFATSPSLQNRGRPRPPCPDRGQFPELSGWDGRAHANGVRRGVEERVCPSSDRDAPSAPAGSRADRALLREAELWPPATSFRPTATSQPRPPSSIVNCLKANVQYAEGRDEGPDRELAKLDEIHPVGGQLTPEWCDYGLV